LNLIPLALKSANPLFSAQAKSMGLVDAANARIQRSVTLSSKNQPITASSDATTASVPIQSSATPSGALVIDKPLRSGQQIYAKGRDLIVLAMVNPGAEVIADGHIHVYGTLRGRAIAGALGDVNAQIFAQVMEPELVSIAGIYRTSENTWPKEVLGKAAHVRLHSGPDGDKLHIYPVVI
jgi:septum site-determining protein MinC